MARESDESYRRAAFFLASRAREAGLRSVLVSSATRGEGVTTTTLHVARELTRSTGLNPLIIELDVEKPVYVERFGLDPEITIQAVANGKLAPKSSIQVTEEGLPVIAAGPEPWPTNREGGTQAVLRRILKQVEAEFDLVMLDTPPLLERAEGLMAGALIRDVLLVVEAGRTRYEMLDRVRAELRKENMVILATVLNKHRRLIPGWVYRWLVR